MSRSGIRLRAALLLTTVACGGCSTSFRIQPEDLARAREGTVRTPERETVAMPARWSAEVHMDENDDGQWMIPPNAGTPVRPVLVLDGKVRAARRARWTDKPFELGQDPRVGASIHLRPPSSPCLAWRLGWSPESGSRTSRGVASSCRCGPWIAWRSSMWTRRNEGAQRASAAESSRG